jgi:hypothetical protein
MAIIFQLNHDTKQTQEARTVKLLLTMHNINSLDEGTTKC